jgi:hypothetical protein
MKFKQYFSSIKKGEIVLFLYVIWGIDFLLTFITLHSGNYYEVNKIGAFFFSLGWWGYLIDILFAGVMFFIFASAIKWTQTQLKTNWMFPLIALGFYYLFEIIIIIHNVVVLI